MTDHQNHSEEQENNLVEITYYTDPLDCWSWAFEPQWRRLRFEFSGKIKWRYRMGGMLPDWDSFSDPLNSVSRPAQMGPMWMEAKHISGMPLNERVWHLNPPSSSFPACVAVKCAGLQSPQAEEWYLRCIREALMLEGRDISKKEVLLEVADKLQKDKPQLFDKKQFSADLEAGNGNEAFRQDLQKARYHQIGRFPSLTLQRPGQTGVFFTGYRPYDALLLALEQVAPDLQPGQKDIDPEAYKAFWGSLTERELQEIELSKTAD